MAGVAYEIRTNSSRAPCSSLQELVDALNEEISAGAQSLVPECTTVELSLDFSAIIPLQRPNIGPYADGGTHDLPQQFKATKTTIESHPQATVADIVSISDQHVRPIVQRAASRGIVAAIEALDGFKYSFNNAWAAKDEDGQRFSYICQDSMQNKDRHANNSTRTQKQPKPGYAERGGIRKPTFDCKGSVSVKCSWNRRIIDVMYRHYAIHATVAERKRAGPAPYKPRDVDVTPQTGDGNEGYGGLFGRLQAEKSSYAPPPAIQTQPPPSLKRKREIEPPVQSMISGEPLSLVDLLNQSQAARSSPTPVGTTPSSATQGYQPSVAYDLPSWAPTPLPPSNYQPPPMRSTTPKRPTQPMQANPPFNAPNPPTYQPTPPPYPQASPTYPHIPPNIEAQSHPSLQAVARKKQQRQPYPGMFMTLKPMPPDQTVLHRTQSHGMFSLQ